MSTNISSSSSFDKKSGLKKVPDEKIVKSSKHSLSDIKEEEINLKGKEDIISKDMSITSPPNLIKIDEETNESIVSGYIIPQLSEKNFTSLKDNSNVMISYLNDKIRYLEAENKSLVQEITKNHSFTEKEKINYYLRLRKELIEENEKLASDKKVTEMSHKSQIEKMGLEIKELKQLLKKAQMSPENRNIQILSFDKPFETKSNLNTSQQTNQSNAPVNVNETQIQHKDTFATNSKFFKNLDKEIKIKDDPAQLEKLLEEIKSKQVGPRNSVYKLDKKDHNNPFIPVIDDLEERVKLLTNTIKEKEADIMELNEVISTNEQIAQRAQLQLQTEITKWKEKYLLILATRKTISQEFSELSAKTTDNIKKSMSKSTYDMESKILHLEKMNKKLNDDMKAMVKADHDIDHQKVSEINNLKRDLKNLMENYDDLYHNYEDSLIILTKQIDSMKQLYLSRENEFIDVTNYYINSLNDYSKPVMDITNNPSNLKLLEESLIAQNKQTEEMRRAAEKHIKENSMIKSENFESKAIMRQKINDAMEYYDKTLGNISDNHRTIEEKLSKITVFMEQFDQKIMFFNSLLEEKKALTDKVNELETKIRRISNDDQQKEVLSLREGNIKLSKELEAKVHLLKEMEEIQESLFNNHSEGKTKIHMSMSTKNEGGNRKSIVKVNREVTMDTITKMKSEIAVLSCKILELSRSKEEIENFYQQEIKKLLGALEERNEHIDELKSLITKNENEHFSKKETIFNLWMIEFKEFKENLISIADVKNLIEKFKVDGNELKVQRDKLVSEEIYLLRQEIKTKDKSIADLKINYKKENTSLNELLEVYKKGIESRLQTMDNLISMKSNEVNALKNEKKRLETIESRKKEVNF